MAPLWTLLAHFAAGRVIQSEPLLPELLDRFGPVARGDAFQVLAPRPQAGPRARPPLLAGSKPKRKKKRRPAGGGEPAKGFAAPEPAEPAAPPKARPTGQRRLPQPGAPAISDDYDRSTIELDNSQMKAEPSEVLAQYVSKSKVEGAATGRVPAEPVPGCEPVFELESLEAFEAARVGSLSEPGLYPQVKAALMALPPDEQAMTTFYQANRDLLDYRFLYMLTSEKLRAENTNDKATSEVLNAARVRALKAGLKFDTALYKQVAAAETRLGGVLSGYVQGKPPDAKAVRAAVGETPSEIFAFWFVLKAAEAAWENKAAENADLAQQAGQKLGDLAEVRGVLESGGLLDRAGAREVNELLKLPDLSGYSLLGQGDGPEVRAAAGEAAARLAELAETDADRLLVVRRMGCLYMQATRHSYQAYQPLVQRSAALYDVLLHGKLMPLASVDIASKPREPQSEFIKMAYRADEIIKQQGVEIPLFW